ncbi:MAG: 6-phosphofructokinase, partial [Treponema sp.]|nr:6-phosphofructokinase [Treponema sp.]
IKTNLPGIKCRSIELSTLQRCASHIASLTDVDEAFMVGYESVKAAFNGETGRVTYFERTSENPYRCEIRICDVSEIANIEKKVPTEWICDGYVTDKIVDYIRPLIQGEVPLAFSNGLPKLLRP